MKPAFLKDEVFLNEVRAALTQGSTRLWWLGQSGFLLAHAGRAALLDPYLSDSLTRKYAETDKPHVRVTERVVDPNQLGAIGVIDLVTCSHAHTDHLDAESLLPVLAQNPGCKLALPGTIRSLAIERLGAEWEGRLIDMNDGRSATLGAFELYALPSAHNEVERDEHGQCKCLGYVLGCGPIRVYHSGDTKWHEGLVPALRPFRVSVALLPINGDRPERRVAGNLDGREAAQLAHDISARLVVPCHFDMFEFNTASPDLFVAECRRLGQAFKVLRNGEGLDLEGWYGCPNCV